MNRDKLDHLILSWLDENCDPGHQEELEKVLLEDEAARIRFTELARLDSEIRDLGEQDQPEVEKLTLVAKRPVVPWLWTAAATIALICVLVVRLPEEQGSESIPAVSDGVAVVSAQAGAEWADKEVKAGNALSPGVFVLKQGLAQIDFYGGASVSLQGPAKLEILSGDKAILHEGKLHADVPPAARGFEVLVDDYRIEDLGTRFGLTVGKERSPELVVFDGEVRAFGKNGKGKLLETGDGGLLKDGSFLPNDAAEFSGYPDINSIVASAGENRESRYTLWKKHSSQLRKDTRLYAYYDFEELTPTSRRLKNRASSGPGSELNGGIVSTRVAPGRWPTKTALDFRREGDRVRFDMPGTFTDLTIYAWVRIDALDRVLNSLFLTDSYDENEFHWQLSREGALNFASSPRGAEDLLKHNRRFFSDRFWSPERSGEWFMLATVVHSSAGKKPVHYINGERVGYSGGANREKPIPQLRIGKADLGNWTDPLWSGSIRTFNGRIDEFAIYKAALTAEEISELFEIGKP